jgi:RHS repeat-associated protein
MSKLNHSYPVQSRASWKSHSGAKSRMVCCFTGKEKDAETNLDYFGVRYLDKDFGMWLTPDPARQYSNLYRRTVNPYNFIDPNGLYERYASYEKPKYIDLPDHQILSTIEYSANSALFAIDQLSMLALEAGYALTEDLADITAPDVQFFQTEHSAVGVVGAQVAYQYATFKDGTSGHYVNGNVRLGAQLSLTAGGGGGWCLSGCIPGSYNKNFTGQGADLSISAFGGYGFWTSNPFIGDKPSWWIGFSKTVGPSGGSSGGYGETFKLP